MTTTVVTISSVLRDAADLIDRVGLYRGEGGGSVYPDVNEPQCALTSINRVQDHIPNSEWVDSFGYLAKFLGLNEPHEVYRWNDRSEDGEVQRVMRAAADKYDEENR